MTPSASPALEPSATAWVPSLGPGVAVRFTGRSDGDFACSGSDALAARRSAVVERPWTALRQVHGATVVRVRHPGDGCGAEADAAVTDRADVALAVLTADCAPIVLASAEGVIAVAHAGWRGLLGGVVERTVAAMRDLGATQLRAALGPCIGPECYEFAPEDLDRVVQARGAALRGIDRHGRPALDLPAGVTAALVDSGVVVLGGRPVCTACSSQHWSWRARQDTARQASVIWLDRP